MGLTSLNNALSGLAISQRQIDVISNNISNVGTEGFTRKILPQSTQVIDGQGAGVRPETIFRNVNLDLSGSLWTQISAVSSNEVQAAYLNRISQFHGPPDQDLSVAAELSRLQDSFALLSDNPLDPVSLGTTVEQAIDVADKINDLSQLITTLRNDAQSDITQTIERINSLLSQIADVNQQIQKDLNLGRSTAAAEDIRDQSLKELSELIDISFFVRGDGVLVVQTNQGAELTGTTAQTLTFNERPVAPTIFYPDTINGIFIGDPDTDPGAVDITTLTPGGRLGGLITLRDETFPKQMAQLDELAHKTALRFEAQGLRLFTDATGAVPSDLQFPDLSTDPETSVSYVGFSSEIRVNNAIINDNTLLQSGTGATPATGGSNEVISRVLDYTFGDVAFQQAVGNVDLNAAAPDLQTLLGLSSGVEFTGSRSLSGFTDKTAFMDSTNGLIDPVGPPPTTQFRITFEEPDLALGPVEVIVDIDALAAPPTPDDFITELTAHINAQIAGAGFPAGLTANATIGDSGQISLTTNGDFTIDLAASPAMLNPMTEAGLELLGLSSQTITAEDPYFEVAVGNGNFTRISITPASTPASLLADLNAVPGLAADIDGVTGFLSLRPGNDFANPEFGGGIQIVGGPFRADGTGTAPNGANIVSAIFGSFQIGPPLQDVSPIQDIVYGSQISDTDLNTVAFREDFLGPGANISTNVLGSRSIVDFAQKMVNEHTQEEILINARADDDTTFKDLLEDQLLNESGVNLDEELSNLIVVQTAYSASAQVLNAVDELFRDLLNAVA